MKKYVIYMFVVTLLTTSINVFSQTTTVTFKPNATVGQDAVIITETGRSLLGNYNFGNHNELRMVSWNYNPKKHDVRSLIKFDQLTSIPWNAKIINAEIKLYGIPSKTITEEIPNDNSYPPFLNNNPMNPLWVQKITSSWDENTVTWNNQPSTTTIDQISVPFSQTNSSWNYTINSYDSPQLLTMLNYMKVHPVYNNGFMLKLQTEDTNRSMLFASSDNSNSSLWPELTVTYEIIDCAFNTCISTTDQDLYTFSALNTYGDDHTWNIYDNNDITIPIYTTNLTSFNYSFPQVGDYYIEHIVNTANQSCTTSVSLCVDQTQISNISAKTTKVENISDDTNNDALIPIDIIKENSIKVYPNPSSDNWNVILTSEKAENVDIIVTDCTGKIVSNDKNNLIKGDNSFIIDGSKLPKGTYVLEIKGETNQFTQKLLKN